MRSEEREARLRSFEALCRESGLSLTVQRRMILQEVLGREDHPAADDVYELVKDRIPGVSRTTVYRVLDTLVRMGVISKVCHPGAAARFDPKIHQHHHLVCTRCDAILDVEDERLNSLALPAIDTRGYRLQEFHVHLRGVCAKCRRRAEKEGGKKPASASRARRAESKGQKTSADSVTHRRKPR